MADEMTDEMLDRLEALSSHVVLRFADTEIAVVPVLVAEVKRLRKEFEIATSMLSSQARMINQMQDTLDRLREPSEAVVKAVKDAIYEELGIDYWDGKTRRILYYAVAAAEREVADDR